MLRQTDVLLANKLSGDSQDRKKLVERIIKLMEEVMEKQETGEDDEMVETMFTALVASSSRQQIIQIFKEGIFNLWLKNISEGDETIKKKSLH